MFTRWNDLDDDGLISGTFQRNNIYRVTETEGMNLNRWYAGNSIAVDEENPQDGLIMGDDPGIRVTITRMEGTHGRIKMDYATQDGLGRAGEHYLSQSGTLVMEEGQTYAHVVIPILPYGVWTNVSFDEFESSITTFNEAPFTLNLFNIRKDDGEPDYIKPQFKNENWQSTGEITATIIVERQPYINLYESNVVEAGDALVDGYHFLRKNVRVRESQGVARLYVDSGLSTCNVYWMALPRRSPVDWGVTGHNWAGDNQTGSGPPFPPGPGLPEFDVNPGIMGSPYYTSAYMELVAGSDYAKPWYWKWSGNTWPTDETPESANIDPFPDGDFVCLGGTLTPGISVISIPLINNDEIDFNQDFFVYLYDIPPCLGVGRWPLDYPQVAQVTIVADGDLKAKNITVDDEGVKKVNLVNDPTRGETPAGAYDRNFNPHSQFDTEPPYNFDPGANNQVHAVAAQRDGKVLIGGDFTSSSC